MLFFQFLTGCSHDFAGYPIAGQTDVLSISSDGQYIISTGENKKAVLWDIKNKKKIVISTNANIYSAYFIKNTHDFIWQDLNDIVHVQNVTGKELNKFHSFPSYGEVMTSNLQRYFASDDQWNLYTGWGDEQKHISKGFLSLYDEYKLLNLTLSQDNKLLLTSGVGQYKYENVSTSEQKGKINLDGVVLWNSEGVPLYKFTGNVEKTFATLSEDGKYIIAVDENERIYIWDSQSGKEINKIIGSFYENFSCQELQNKMVCKSNRIGYPPFPKFINKLQGTEGVALVSVKFIDKNNDYLIFPNSSPYAILYNIKDKIPKRYLYLGVYPWPTVNYYHRDETIDTAPDANILVTGQENGPGIIVYKFDPKTLTLKKIWAPGADYPHLIKLFFLNLLLVGILFYPFRRTVHLATLILTTLVGAITIYFAFFYFYRWDIAVDCLGTLTALFFLYFVRNKQLLAKRLQKQT